MVKVELLVGSIDVGCRKVKTSNTQTQTLDRQVHLFLVKLA